MHAYTRATDETDDQTHASMPTRVGTDSLVPYVDFSAELHTRDATVHP